MVSARRTGVLLAALISVADAIQTTFHLIAPTEANPRSVEVVFGGSTNVVLNASNAAIPHYVGTADVPKGTKYKYIVDGTAEPFERTVPGDRSDTYNDFYNRSVTVQALPPFPWPLQDEGPALVQWQRAAPLDPLFDDSYIPTLLFAESGGSSETGTSGGASTLYVILKDQIVEFPNTQLREYKGDSWKMAYTFNFTANTDKFGGRNQFKLRPGEFDPTQLREKTYTDIMNALGVPVAQQIHVRVYENGKPLGLYILTDLNSAITEGQRNFGFVAFENGDPSKLERLGVTLDCGTGATLDYKTDNPTDYNACYGGDMSRSDPHMVTLAKTLAAVDANNVGSQDALEKVFDVDTFLRQMVMEYLALNWDGYWSQSSNFVMYFDEFGTGKWYFSDQDFDQTFGSGNEEADNPPASYKAYPTKGPDVPSGGRPLIEKLLAVPKWRSRFEFILTETVKHTFNPVAFNGRIDAFVQILRSEVQWDHSFKEDSGRHFYFEDFDKGLTEPTVFRTPLANGTGVGWGLKTFVEARASGVAREFSFAWDTTPRYPSASSISGAPASGTSPPSTPVGGKQGANSVGALAHAGPPVLGFPAAVIAVVAASVMF